MQKKSSKENRISRRGVLPIIGSSLLIPFLGFGNSKTDDFTQSEDNKEEYQTLIKPDGTAVRVNISTLKKSKIIKKNLSNKSFLNWLGKKL
ncbi:MAG: hypothetical protein KAH67_02665 [Flavobacteriaceae bacterium]|nr:hypothetical protein [Flavobacteriaceae bacterium]